MREKNIASLRNVWNSFLKETSPTFLSNQNISEILSGIVSVGSFYSFIFDVHELSISNIIGDFESVHGVSPENITLDDIFSLIHPEDLGFVAKADAKLLALFYDKLGPEEMLNYKMSYNFRVKGKDGNYLLVNHQTIVLTLDDQKNFSKGLNIHTRIDHLTEENNYKASLIGMNGRESIIDISLENNSQDMMNFTNRELEVIRGFSNGLSYKEIAEELFISKETVKSHRKNILKKAEVNSVEEVIVKCVKLGIIT